MFGIHKSRTPQDAELHQLTPSRKDRRNIVKVFAVLLTATALLTFPTAAFAYTTTGAKWPTKTLRIDVRYVNGNFLSGINSAKTNYNGSTHVALSTTATSGPTWTAANSNYGATGWEAYSTWTSPFGITTACSMEANQWYLSGTEPVTQLKVVWAHEMGHCLGLNHVTGIHHVMYSSASGAYMDGVTGLTSDEISGINSLY